MKTLSTFILFSSLSVFSGLAHAGQVPVLNCSGTEPFWTLKTNTLGFLSMNDSMSDSKKFYLKTKIKNAHGMALGSAFQIEAQDMLKNTLKLNVVKTSCSDGMSDEIYPYTALVDVDGGIYFGCCR